MEAPLKASTEDVRQLRRCINDLVSILALPALWTGGEPPKIVSTLLDTLLGILRLDLVYVRVNDPAGGPPDEMVRVAEGLDLAAPPREIGAAVDRALGALSGQWPPDMRLPIAGLQLSVLPARLGLHGDMGVVVAASRRADFPGQTERLLLNVAANQAAIGLQEARLLSEEKRVAKELDQRVALRTAELAAANDELKREIAERRRAEEDLRQSERNSRQIVDGIPALIALLGPTGEAEVFNNQALEYFGRALGEQDRWERRDVVHPEDLPHVLRVFTESIASGRPYEIEQRLRRGDGSYRWFQNSGRPIRDAHGDVIRWCVLLTDIDERKRAEQARQRSEAFLAEGLHLARMGNFSWCVATDQILWSEQLYRIFGFDSDTPITLELIATRMHPEDLPLLHDMVERARRGESAFEYEHRLLMPDRSIKYLRLIAHGTRGRDGRLEYIGAVQDVTQRRTSEEALGQARSELARVARVMSFGALTASIAHEVNQPLAGIITNASTCMRMLAADPPDVEGARETARRTIRDGNRASDVIARLRALFGKKEATSELVDLNDATREVIALSMGEFQRGRVVLRAELSEGLPPVSGDRVQLQQVILNLLRNATDAMLEIEDRPRRLVIRTERADGDGVCVTVQDSGVGFDAAAAEKLFDAFYTTKSGGMGIGLSVSRSIVERHRGRIWAEPNDGPGATFSFSIPAVPMSMADVAPVTRHP